MLSGLLVFADMSFESAVSSGANAHAGCVLRRVGGVV
jgi:hypothetical protein